MRTAQFLTSNRRSLESIPTATMSPREFLRECFACNTCADGDADHWP
jgi:hypothetical protein